MPEKIRWGVLGAARIGTQKVIPAMQGGASSQVDAIASREIGKARDAAKALGIPKAYGSYEELLADPEIDAIYNPLPNHLHVEWTEKAAVAGKHVLCEKPIGLNAGEAKRLIEIRERTGVKIGEAFMTRTAPQWLRTREIAQSGKLGELRSIVWFFSYNNRDPRNIRNVPEYGGWALMDIGCYAITMSRFLFGEEPKRVLALMERDPEMGTDRLTSALMDFPNGHAIFTCSTQLTPFQRMQAFGSMGRVEIEIPVNTLPDKATRIFVNGELEEIPACDQYTIQGDLFSQAIQQGGEVPVPLEESVRNMTVIDALVRSARSGGWEAPEV
jgi:predicted dehydrogenase